MTFIGETWQLRDRSGGVVGEIRIEDADFPWLHGRFVEHPGFRELRPLFDRELALLDRIDEAVEEWEAAYDAVTDAVTLVAPDTPVAEFLLHVEGDKAWFRWSEEPFDGD